MTCSLNLVINHLFCSVTGSNRRVACRTRVETWEWSIVHLQCVREHQNYRGLCVVVGGIIIHGQASSKATSNVAYGAHKPHTVLPINQIRIYNLGSQILGT